MKAQRYDALAGLSDADLKLVLDKIEHWKDTDRDYHNRQRKRARLRQAPTPVDLTGQPVYVCADLLSDGELRERNMVPHGLEVTQRKSLVIIALGQVG